MPESDAPTPTPGQDQVATVFVVDDDETVRTSLTQLLRSVDQPFETFASAEAFLQSQPAHRRGCIVLDVRMPGMGGVALQEELQASDIDMPVIFLTAHGEVPLVARVMRAGATEFLEKPFSPQKLLQVIQDALERDRWAFRQRQERARVQALVCRLTEREKQIMEDLVRGKEAKAIAVERGVVRKTVDTYRRSILDKMGVQNVAQLVGLVVSARSNP